MAASGDTRRIQTAVLGHKDSDEPLALPQDAFELDVFRHLYAGATYWCGVLLGGCGGQLMTKLYTDRVCHFAHYPDPDGLPTVCTRASRGVGSADHLYFKAAASAWLSEQGQGAHFHFARHAGTPVGSVVDVDVEGGMRLRVHINAQVPVRWDLGDGTETVLGPGVPVHPDTLAHRRYVNRVRFYSDGPCRRMQIGTEVPGRGTDWFALEECSMAPDGLVTPTVAELRQRWKEAATVASVQRAEPAVAAEASRVKRAPAPAGSQTSARVNRLVVRLATAQRADHAAEVEALCEQGKRLLVRLNGDEHSRLRAAVAAADRWLVQKDRLRQVVFTRLRQALNGQRVEETRSMLQQAITLDQQGHPLTWAQTDLMAEARRFLDRFRPHNQVPRTGKGKGGGRSAGSGRDADAAGTVGRPRDRQPGREAGQPGRQAGQQPGRTVPLPNRPVWTPIPVARAPQDLDQVAKAVRGALLKTAREQGVTSWIQLRQQLGSALPRLSPQEQERVVLLVDRATKADQPPLSTLLAAGDPGAVTAYRQSATNLGLDVPEDPDVLRDVLEADAASLHRLWHGR
ncbi:hypothetical protein [Streptomyces sp. MI02-7b]|uniref:hypothetical protein n=1 Tax=Streptomyces sp. MI02-7b TaxID=462941 RepID=UPI0029B8127F|nr:hypothetical protein [Streptomyces sp. MI02-7b]MDX3077899.1 hypothetical protein [Streptomyces sp. MI02-7b]